MEILKYFGRQQIIERVQKVQKVQRVQRGKLPRLLVLKAPTFISIYHFSQNSSASAVSAGAIYASFPKDEIPFSHTTATGAKKPQTCWVCGFFQVVIF